MNCMTTRNITFHLPAELIREAKVYAAEHDTSVNALVKELLEEKLTLGSRIPAAGRRMLDLAEQGPSSSVDPGSIRRDELHERR